MAKDLNKLESRSNAQWVKIKQLSPDKARALLAQIHGHYMYDVKFLDFVDKMLKGE